MGGAATSRVGGGGRGGSGGKGGGDDGELLPVLGEQVSLLESQNNASEIKSAQELWRAKMAERTIVPPGDGERAMTTGSLHV